MTEILAVFRSRSQAMDLEWKLKSIGIAAKIINTPKEANIGCGLSILIPQEAYQRARVIVRRQNYSAFYGYLTVTEIYGRKVIGRI